MVRFVLGNGLWAAALALILCGRLDSYRKCNRVKSLGWYLSQHQVNQTDAIQETPKINLFYFISTYARSFKHVFGHATQKNHQSKINT